jgi:hypothetical protein
MRELPAAVLTGFLPSRVPERAEREG